MYGIDLHYQKDADLIVDLCEQAIAISGATIIGRQYYEGTDCLHIGLTLSESHLTLHMSKNSCHLDIFTCGNICVPEDGVKFLVEHFNPKKVYVDDLKRGI